MRALLGNNPHLKVLALTLTIVLYFFVASEKETSRDFTIELSVGSVPEGHVVLNALPDVVVTLRGGARAFASIQDDSLRNITLDITDPDTDRREIREADLELPSHFTVVSIAPRWVPIELEQMVTRELPVRPVVRGTPARGFDMSDPVATPSQLTVSAPASYFPAFDAVFTESVNITGATESRTETVAPSIQRPYVTYPLDTTIEVQVEITTLVETRTLEGVPIMITGPDAARCALDAGSLALILTGPKSLVDSLDPHELFAGVECSTFAAQGAGVYLPEASVKNLPQGIQVLEAIPSTLRLTVSEPEPEPEPEPTDPLFDTPLPAPAPEQ